MSDERGLLWDSWWEFRRDRGFEDGDVVEALGEWSDEGTIYKLGYVPSTGDVFAREVAPNAGGAGEVELLAEGIVALEVVEAALWLDDPGDEASRALRVRDEDTTTLAWARKRLTVTSSATGPPPRDENAAPGILG